MNKPLRLTAYVLGFGIVVMTTGCGFVKDIAPTMVNGSITLMPSPVTLVTGQTIQMAAMKITDGPNGIEDITQTAIWQSSSPEDLSVIAGRAKCNHAGTYLVSAALQVLEQSIPVTCKLLPAPTTPTTPTPAPTNPPTTPPAPAPTAPPAPAPTAPPAPAPTAPAPAPTAPTAPAAPTAPTAPAPAPTAPTAPAPTAPTAPAPLLTGIQIINPPSIVRSNAPYQLKVQGTYADKSTTDITNQTSWKSDSVARTSTTGVMFCNTAGTATISASVGGYTSTLQTQCLMKQITAPPGFAEQAVNFYGPFPSWLNVKDFGAAGDGIADDTYALQSALASAILQSKTVWIPKGVYRITNPLNVVKADGITIIGEDPRTTSVFYDGAAGGNMIEFIGSSHFRIQRLSLNCNSFIAAVGIHITYDSNVAGQLYPTFDAIEDSRISGCGIGIEPEFGGETTINRVHFDHNFYGVNLANWNALNFNIIDSLFTDNAIGVSNLQVAGAYNVSNSVFVRSTIRDMEMGNTSAFSIRHNLSVGSKTFFFAGPIDSNAAVTIEGNVVIDTQDVPIVYGNQGAVTLMDNTFDMPSHPQRPIFLAADWLPALVSSIGNTYTTSTPYQTQAGSLIKVTSVDEAPQATVASFERSIPTEVYIPPTVSSQIVEAPIGAVGDDLQNALNEAARLAKSYGRATFHIPSSTFYLNTTLDVPDAPGLAIVGDGMNTGLRPGPMLLGPVMRTHGSVEVDNLFVSSSRGGSSLDIVVDDQPSTRVICDICTTVSTQQSMLVSGLDHASISTWATTLNGDRGVSLSGGPSAAKGLVTLGRMDAFMTTTDTYNISKGGHFLISDGWHDAGQAGVQAIVSDNSVVTHQGGSICATDPQAVRAIGLTGQLSLVGVQINTTVTADAASNGALGLIGSITGGYVETQLRSEGTNLMVVHSGDTINTPLGEVSINSSPSAAADVNRVLSQSRTDYIIPRQSLVVPATYVRMHRVATGDGAVGITISASQGKTTGATYTISSPSSTSALSSCPSGSMSLDGSWSLISGGDGYYGMLHNSLYLSNRIAPDNSPDSLGSAESMLDAGQRWLIQAAGDGLFRIVNRADGAYLTRNASGCATMNAPTEGVSQEWAVTAQ